MDHNIYVDYNNITQILYVSFFLRTLKLVMIILVPSYYLGVYWYIFCNFVKDMDENQEGFITVFEIIESRDLQREELIGERAKTLIKFTYFAFTTLTTIGLGDYHPRNDMERLMCVVIMLVGVTMFGSIMRTFL